MLEQRREAFLSPAPTRNTWTPQLPHNWVSILLALNHYADVEGCMEEGGPERVAICGVV